MNLGGGQNIYNYSYYGLYSPLFLLSYALPFGKSFLACCIANALIDKQVRASVTNFPRILNKLQGFGEDKQEFLDKLSRYDLLVIDDLGVERDTSYSVEQVFNVIDARSRTGKLTTSLGCGSLGSGRSMLSDTGRPTIMLVISAALVHLQ